MEAGRELDFLIARDVMNLKEAHFQAHLAKDHYIYLREDGNYVQIPHYSTDIAAAVLVAEKLRPTCDIYIEFHRSDYVICRIVDYSKEPKKMGKEPWAKAETAPLAVCLAVKEWLERG